MQLVVDNSKNKNIIDSIDQRLIASIQNGLPISDRPYAEIANQLELSEKEVIDRISNLRETGFIKRFGVVVRHHELGYKENAMIVWDIPDNLVHSIADKIKSYPFITLCYRRARQLPEWQYNLYCMIHGKSRNEVMLLLNEMLNNNNWHNYTYDVLFSKRRFKQSAANYISK